MGKLLIISSLIAFIGVFYAVSKRYIFALLSLFLLSPTALLSQMLEIHHINVQQGDCVLILGPNGTSVLVDAGKNGKGTSEVVPYLTSIGILASEGLDYFIGTHMDADHIGGIDDIIKAGYNINNKIYDNGSSKTTSTITAYRNAASTTAAGTPERIIPGTIIDLGDGARITCIASGGEVIGLGQIPGANESENDMSVVLLVEYGNFDYILGGDLGGGDDDNACTGRSTGQSNVETSVARAITPGGQTPLLTVEGVDVLHVNHHGSESSTNSDYMNLLKPEVATINVGLGQGYNWYHPRKDVVDNVLMASVDCIEVPAVKAVYQTEEGSPFGANTSTTGYAIGDIIIKTSGESTYEISGTGDVSQGPDERVEAQMPKVYQLDEIEPSDQVIEVALDHVVFSEVFYDPKGRREANKEWIELYNPLMTSVDISGWKVIDNNGQGGSYAIPEGTRIEPNSFLTIARNSKGFKKLYGFAPDVSGLSFGLNNSGDALVLKSGDLVIDAVGWESGASGGLPSNWGSDSQPSASEKESIQRTNPNSDTDTFTDWKSTTKPTPGS